MREFAIATKLFFKTISILVPYVLLLIAVNIGLRRLAASFTAAKKSGQMADAMYYFGDINVFCFLLFLFFLFIGYEFMRKVRESQTEELFSSYGMSGVRIYIEQFLVLLFSVVLVSANISAYYIWGYMSLECEEELAAELFRLLLVNVFFVSLGAVSLGTVLSRIRNRFAGYGVMVGILFLILPNTVSFFEMMQEQYHIPVFGIRDLVCLIPPDIWSAPDALYGFPLEEYRVAAMLFWVVCVAVFLVVKMFRICKREKRFWYKRAVCAGVAVSLCLAAGGLVWQTSLKGSVLLMADHPESALSQTRRYYAGHEGGVKSDEPEFSVSEYDMKLEIGKELEAGVWMTIAPGQIPPEYHFTLDHSYRVREVLGQDGSPLMYSREGDYINIQADGRRLEKIYVSYRGHSPVFYANKKSCFLPGLFAWYPREGYHNVYGDSTYFGINGTKKLFSVSVGREGMISNLEKTENGFRGEAENVLLLDGFYRVSREKGYQTVTYPMIESEEEGSRQRLRDLPGELEELEEYLGMGLEKFCLTLPEKVFMIPNGMQFNSLLGSFFLYDDYALISQNTTAYDILKYQADKYRAISPEKKKLYDIFLLYRPDGDRQQEEMLALLVDMAPAYKGEGGRGSYESEEEELEAVFAEKIRELGTQDAARRVAGYLFDEEDHTDPFDFLYSLNKKEGSHAVD